MVSMKDAEEARDDILMDTNTNNAVKAALLINLPGVTMDQVDVTSVTATEAGAGRRLQTNVERGLLNVSFEVLVPSSDAGAVRETAWVGANASFATYLLQLPTFADKLMNVDYSDVKEGEVLSNGVILVEATTSAEPTAPSTSPESLGGGNGNSNDAASASLIGGIILAVLLACLAVFLCIWMWKRRQEPKNEEQTETNNSPAGQVGGPGLAVVSPANQADMIEASSDDEARPVQDHIVGQNASVMQYSV